MSMTRDIHQAYQVLKEVETGNKKRTHFEHLRTIAFPIGDNSAIQLLVSDEDFPISSRSSSNVFLLLANHLNDPSLTKPSIILLVLLAIAISPFSVANIKSKQKYPTTTQAFPIHYQAPQIKFIQTNPTFSPTK